MKRRSLLKAGLIIGSSFAGGVSSSMADALPNQAAVNKFYNMGFNDVNGNKHLIKEYKPRVLVVNFWATWCPPCVKEMPELNQLHNKYDDVTVVGLAIDTLKNVNKFSSRVMVDYPILMAGHDGIKVMKDLGNSKGGLPYTLIFDAEGIVKNKFLGQVSLDMLEPLLS